VLKSRGMKHSNQIREFIVTSEGIKLEDVYVGAEGVLTGSMRAAQEDREKAALQARAQEFERKQRDLARRRAVLEAQITALRAEFEAAEEESKTVAEQDRTREQQIAENRSAAALRRGADAAATKGRKK
jgi:circadian clock protein KaiC